MINISEMMKQFEFQDEQIRSQRMLIGELLEKISEQQDTIKRVESLAESLKAEGCLRGMNNTIRARVGDEIAKILKGGGE